MKQSILYLKKSNRSVVYDNIKTGCFSSHRNQSYFSPQTARCCRVAAMTVNPPTDDQSFRVPHSSNDRLPQRRKREGRKGFQPATNTHHRRAFTPTQKSGARSMPPPRSSYSRPFTSPLSSFLATQAAQGRPFCRAIIRPLQCHVVFAHVCYHGP
jgi:hypothetical protein